MNKKNIIWIFVAILILLGLTIAFERLKISGSITINQDSSTYTDVSKTFSFSYPNKFIISSSNVGYPQDWRAEATTSGTLLVALNIPQSILPNTNFGEAKFTVGRSTDPDAIKNCLSYDYGGEGSTNEVTIGQRKFTRVTFVGVGAGNYYDTTSYRTTYNNQCYAIEYTIHSSNIDNYSSDQGITEFDKTKVTSILEDIVQSFRFF